ncbi:cobalt-precorrin 5A hydrolase [Devosia lucknowensis]|uniref:Cobalt-precorrin 5A hydrolase n=1 Tax=Devosia lucknowensis TaxID=1096929 RepID=A0A1Y6EA24_9HYPH|nr:cobalamin biosynthesis protein [Devosia lucknowensis]SMQ59386.1 cobalt-precorrin 5A hydrolase [Devosia lucknowensis]
MTERLQGLFGARTLSSRSGLVAGIGLRAGCSAEDIVAMLDQSLGRLSATRADLVALATLDAKARHPALLAVAKALDIALVALARDDLGGSAPNPSVTVLATLGLPSVAEASALAFGPLLLEKQRGANVTCAISRYDSVAAPFSAAIAASTLATSSAGP